MQKPLPSRPLSAQRITELKETNVAPVSTIDSLISDLNQLKQLHGDETEVVVMQYLRIED